MDSIESKIKSKLKCFATTNSEEEVTIITVSDSHINALNRCVEKKIRQNEVERNASMEVAAKYVVGGRN
jgi:hypothetical protein